jgi:hypothetical protein
MGRALVVEEWQASAETISSANTEPGDREGDIMLATEDRPTGHEEVTPHRRSPGRWLLVAAAAVVVAVLGTLIVAAGGDDDDEQIDAVSPTPTTAAPARDAMRGPFEPGGRYFVDPDGDDATPLRVTFQVATEGWSNWFGAVKPVPGEGDGFTGLSITTVTNLVSDGCRDHTALDPPVGPTVDDLAIALSQLAPFEVTAPPTDVTLFGYQGKRLELTVPALTVTGGGEATPSRNIAQFTDCVEGELHSWISPINDRSPGLLGHSTSPERGSFNAYQAPGQTEEFWILDVEGTRVVLVSFDSPLSPAADIAERDAMFDSIRIEP